MSFVKRLLSRDNIIIIIIIIYKTTMGDKNKNKKQITKQAKKVHLN